MGGSSKPEPAKPTPFVQPPAPKTPVPNWFQNRPQQATSGFVPTMRPQHSAMGQFGQVGQMPGASESAQMQTDPRLAQLQALIQQLGLLNGGQNGR